MKNSQMLACASFLIYSCSSVTPSAATTVYCDNDRAVGQYPHCHNVSNTGWNYGSGGADWNGDDRRGRLTTSRGGTTYYNFVFDGSYVVMKYSAWLANSAFNQTRAEYRDGIGHLDRYINQNTAPSGWNSIGQGDAGFAVGFDYPTTKWTGADLIKGILVSGHLGSESGSVVEGAGNGLGDSITNDDVAAAGTCPAVSNVMDPRVAAIQQKMLNAVDHYADVEGRYRISFTNNQQDEVVDFQISESGRRALETVTEARSGQVVTFATDATSITNVYPQERTYRTRQVAPTSLAGSASSELRRYMDTKCQPVSVHRDSPARVVASADMTLPENYAFWLDTAQASVVGQDRLLNRDVTIVQGTPDAYLQDKLGASTFKMWVDDDTGMLLKLIGTATTGGEAFSIEPLQLSVDSGSDPAAALTELAERLATWTPITN